MKNILNKKEKRTLLKLARKSIATSYDDEMTEIDLNNENLKRKCGCFVTLNKDGNLRGCIGNIVSRKPLFKGVIQNARGAAFEDPRFQALSKEELTETSIEISVISKPENINYSDENDLFKKIVPGKDGIIIKKGYSQATYLPQVWEQFYDSKNEMYNKRLFFSHLCSKAGLSHECWKNKETIVQKYNALVFSEEDMG